MPTEYAFLTGLFLYVFEKSCDIDNKDDIRALNYITFLVREKGLPTPSFGFRLTECGVMSSDINDALHGTPCEPMAFNILAKEQRNIIDAICSEYDILSCTTDTKSADILGAIATITYLRTTVLHHNANRRYTIDETLSRCPMLDIERIANAAYDAYLRLFVTGDVLSQTTTSYIRILDNNMEKFRELCKTCRIDTGSELIITQIRTKNNITKYGFRCLGKIVGLSPTNEYKGFVESLQSIIPPDETLVIETLRYSENAAAMPDLTIETITSNTYRRTNIRENIEDSIPQITID